MASFATQADIIYAEPGALICFTGPKVMKCLNRREVKSMYAEDYFQRGLVDKIVTRNELSNQLESILDILNEDNRSLHGH